MRLLDRLVISLLGPLRLLSSGSKLLDTYDEHRTHGRKEQRAIGTRRKKHTRNQTEQRKREQMQ